MDPDNNNNNNNTDRDKVNKQGNVDFSWLSPINSTKKLNKRKCTPLIQDNYNNNNDTNNYYDSEDEIKLSSNNSSKKSKHINNSLLINNNDTSGDHKDNNNNNHSSKVSNNNIDTVSIDPSWLNRARSVANNSKWLKIFDINNVFYLILNYLNTQHTILARLCAVNSSFASRIFPFQLQSISKLYNTKKSSKRHKQFSDNMISTIISRTQNKSIVSSQHLYLTSILNLTINNRLPTNEFQTLALSRSLTKLNKLILNHIYYDNGNFNGMTINSLTIMATHIKSLTSLHLINCGFKVCYIAIISNNCKALIELKLEEDGFSNPSNTRRNNDSENAIIICREIRNLGLMCNKLIKLYFHFRHICQGLYLSNLSSFSNLQFLSLKYYDGRSFELNTDKITELNVQVDWHSYLNFPQCSAINNIIKLGLNFGVLKYLSPREYPQTSMSINTFTQLQSLSLILSIHYNSSPSMNWFNKVGVNNCLPNLTNVTLVIEENYTDFSFLYNDIGGNTIYYQITSLTLISNPRNMGLFQYLCTGDYDFSPYKNSNSSQRIARIIPTIEDIIPSTKHIQWLNDFPNLKNLYLDKLDKAILNKVISSNNNNYNNNGSNCDNNLLNNRFISQVSVHEAPELAVDV